MAHLLIIELPGGNDTDIVQAAIARGDDFTFLSAQLDHYRRQPQVQSLLDQAYAQIEVLGFDYAQVESAVLELHARFALNAVLCLLDIRLIEAARLAQRLKLRHISPSTAVLLRDKFKVRQRLAERGLTQPEFALAQSNDELKQAVATMGLPLLIKPSDGYGSQNVVVLRHDEDLDPWLTPLEDMLPSHTDYGLGVKANDRLLVERYMAGTVIGCDTLSVDGQHRLLGVNEKLFFEPPSFAIRGGCFQPDSPAFAAIQRYVFACLDAVDFDWGATHTEIILTADGPRLVEINARLVGAKIARLVGYALKRSIHSDLITVHLGQQPSFSTVSASSLVAVTRWIVAEQAGVLEHIELPAWRDDRIRCVEVLKRPGDAVRAPFENADRIGYVMVCGSTRAQAEELAEHFVAQTRVVLKPTSTGSQ
jgi:biotin carboxylase